MAVQGMAAQPQRFISAFRLALLGVCFIGLAGLGMGGNIIEASGAPATTSAVATVRLNQVGYLPGAAKVAVIPAAAVPDASAPVFVLPATSGSGQAQPAWSGRLQGPIVDPLTGESVYQVDFSSLSTAGRYVVQIGAAGPAQLRSVPFIVGTDFLPALFVTVTRSYYLQRCGIAINDPISGLAHGVCHMNDGFVRRADGYATAKERLNVTGGWHDAGDYGKYATTTAVTAGQLLLLFELAPDAFPDGQLQIPDSGNGIPDLLDEARVGLEWLLRMQRPDGAVYHKIGPDSFPGIYVSPDKDRMPRFIAGVTSQDTAKAAATWAMGARLFQPYDPLLAARLLGAARQAWSFLADHPDTVDETRPADNTGSGAYGDNDDGDDRYWAAAELYVTTGEAAFAQYLRFTTPLMQWQEIGWTDAAAIGMFDLAWRCRGTADLADLADGLRELILDQAAEQASAAAAANPYGVMLAGRDFTWASNKVALAGGVNLLLASRLASASLSPQQPPSPSRPEALVSASTPAPDADWAQLAMRQLDWVLGANPLGKSFVTGVGVNPVQNPHHRPSAARWQAVPGLLVGGPNSRAEDGVAPAGLGPLSYTDETAAYSVNEPAIDYNAPLVVLLGLLLAKTTLPN